MVDGNTRAVLGGKMQAMLGAHAEYHRARREARWATASVAAGAALALLAAVAGRGAPVGCVAGGLLLLVLAWLCAGAWTKLASARNRLIALMNEAAKLCDRH